MAADRDAGVDPRFDPQFQRGYDPVRHGPSRPRRPSAPAAPASELPSGPVPSDAAERPADAGRLAPEVARDEGEAPRRNPFRLILLLASLAAIGGSALLFWRRIAEDPYGGYGGYGGDVGAVFVQQFTDAIFAPLLTAGILGVCLWLVLGALSRRDG